MEKLTIKEAAEYIGKSTSWLRKKILNNEIHAEKESFKYGERYIIEKQELDNYQKIAKMKKESIDVVEVEEKISKKDLMNELVEAVYSQNKKLINKSIKKVTDKIDQQNKAIEKLINENENIKRELNKIRKHQDKSLWNKVTNIIK